MTGIVILLPLLLTIWIVGTIIHWLTDPFLGATQQVLSACNVDMSSLPLLKSEQFQRVASKLLVLVFLFFSLVVIGAVGRYVFVRTLIKWGDAVVRKIPLISSVYYTVQELMKTVLSSEKKAFKQVVLVPFPHAGCWTVGLLTQDESTSASSLPVFVPTTPNPTSGYLILFRRSDIIPLSMSVEEAFRYVVSCGVLLPEKGMLAAVPSSEGI